MEPASRNGMMNRREFVERGVWLVGAAVGFLLGTPLIGVFLSGLFSTAPEQWVAVCPVDQINSDEPVQFRVACPATNAPRPYEDVRGVFVIRRGADILAFTNICTHMSCSVRWLRWREQIVCPCHGGIYDRWGNLAGGPPAGAFHYS